METQFPLFSFCFITKLHSNSVSKWKYVPHVLKNKQTKKSSEFTDIKFYLVHYFKSEMNGKTEERNRCEFI